MVHKSNDVDETCKSTPKNFEVFKNRVSKMDSVVRQLENSLLESQQNDRQLLSVLQRDGVKNEKLTYQLDEARKENKQLLNILQKQNSGDHLSWPSSRSQSDVSSYSTVSMVHLQYKYEELLSSHEGLLKVLETKARECQKCYGENDELCNKIQNLTLQVANSHRTINTLCEKYMNLKQRKDGKVAALKYERDTLRLAHNQVVNLLHKKCMNDDHVLGEELQKTFEPVRSLLIKEIKRTNKLQHENSRLQQENTILKFQLNVLKNTKCPCYASVTNSGQ